MNQIRTLGPSTPWRCQPHDNRPPAAWMIPAWALLPQPWTGAYRITPRPLIADSATPALRCHSRARGYTIRPGADCTCDSTAGGRPESRPKLRCEKEGRRRKSLSPLGCSKARTLRPRTGVSSTSAGSQLVLPKDAGAPDERSLTITAGGAAQTREAVTNSSRLASHSPQTPSPTAV